MPTIIKKTRTKRRPIYKAKRKINYRRKRKFRAKGALVNRGKVFPNRYFTKLHYETGYYTFSASATEPCKSIILRGNSLYDPEFATGGGQPSGFDVLKQVYRYYKVHASSIHCKVTTTNSNSTMSAQTITAYPSDSPVLPPVDLTAADIAYGYPNSKYKELTIAPASRPMDRTFYHKLTTKKAKGIPDIRSLWFNTGCDSNPTGLNVLQGAPWYWIISCWNPIHDVAPGSNYFIKVKMTFWVEMNTVIHQRDLVLNGDPTTALDAIKQESATGTQMFYQPSFAGTGLQMVYDAT